MGSVSESLSWWHLNRKDGRASYRAWALHRVYWQVGNNLGPIWRSLTRREAHIRMEMDIANPSPDTTV